MTAAHKSEQVKPHRHCKDTDFSICSLVQQIKHATGDKKTAASVLTGRIIRQYRFYWHHMDANIIDDKMAP